MPRKVFVAGEILTAADVNTNLMDQAVMVFADSAARGSAIPSPSEGMVTYLSDVNQVQAYTGAAFTPVGGILQVVSATKTDTFSTSSTSFVDITGFTATITPSATTSKIFISATIAGSNTGTTGARTVIFQLVRDSTNIAVGDTAGGRSVGSSALFGLAAETRLIYAAPISFLDSPNTTSAVTYKVQVRTLGNSAVLNRSADDSDNSDSMRTVSSITLMEVAG
jgi:hypothetical protein